MTGPDPERTGLLEPERLLVRREPDKSFTLLGTVVSESAGLLTIRDASGELSEAPRRGNMLVTAGSIPHLQNLHPGLLEQLFEDEPRAVLEQVLVDSPSPLSTAQLKQKLLQVGMPSELVEKHWPELKKVLATSSDVRKQGPGQGKYEWTSGRQSRLRRFVQEQDHGGSILSTSADAALGGAQAVEPVAVDAAAAPPDYTPSETDLAQPVEVAADTDPLVAELRKVLGEVAPESRDRVAGSVLQIGEALSDVADKDLMPLTRLEGEEGELAVLVMLARDREPAALRSRQAPLPATLARAAMMSAIAEVGPLPEASASLRRRFRSFVARLLIRANVHDLPLTLVTGAFINVSVADDGEQPSRQTLAVAGTLVDRAAAATAREWDELGVGIQDVARHSRRLRLEPDGPRAQLLTEIHRVRPDLAIHPAFWRDVTTVEIAVTAGTTLRTLFHDQQFAATVAAPMIRDRVASLTTRQGLAEILALPGVLCEYVDANALADAMGRVSTSDNVFREWHHVFRRTEELELATAESMRSSEAARAAEARASDLTVEVSRLQTALDEATARLTDVRRANEQAREAGNRQAKINTLRSLANVALAVKQSPAASEDAALVQRVDFALKREGLVSIGTTADVVPYDPAVHDALGDHVDKGTPVSVLRPGYTYSDGGEVFALVKAQVHAD